MHSSKLLHGCTAALRADADIKIPDRFEQFRHGHTGITLPETLSALKFKNNRQVVCLHAVVQETIVPDFLKTGGQDVHQIAADEFNVVQCNGAFWAAGF